MGQGSASAGLWSNNDERQAEFNRRFWLAVGSSLFLHLVLLAVAAWVRLPQQSERPLASIEVSLASLPTLAPPVKEVSPPKSRPKVVEPSPQKKAPAPPKSQAKVMESPKVVEPPPAPPVKEVPVIPPAPPIKEMPAVPPAPPVKEVSAVPPAPPVKEVPVIPPAPPIKEMPAVPPPQVKASVNDLMKSLELPPRASKLGDFSPPEKPAKKQFKLPDVPVAASAQERAQKASDVTQQPLLTDDLNKELEDELQNIKKIDLPKAPQPEVMPKPAPQVEAKAPSIKAVDAALKVPGMAPGSNIYLGLVRQRISSFWTAPPVDITGRTHVVIVRFRLHRDGKVTKVEIEHSSGNEYYDLAGKRAVLSADPLPAFPPELTEPHFDAHFTFTVGDSQG